MSVELGLYGGPYKDQEAYIPWNFHCFCRHVAASHWYATGHGTLVSGRCHECPLQHDIDICSEFKADNLVHLEQVQKEKESKVWQR